MFIVNASVSKEGCVDLIQVTNLRGKEYVVRRLSVWALLAVLGRPLLLVVIDGLVPHVRLHRPLPSLSRVAAQMKQYRCTKKPTQICLMWPPRT